MRIALVHDFLTQHGGAERFLEAVASYFSEHTVDIYTLCYYPEKFPDNWKRYNVKKLARSLPKIDYYPQLYAYYLVPLIEQLDLSYYDLVFSSDLIFAKHVVVSADVPHISYHHTPAVNLYPIHKGYSSRGALGFLSMFPKSYLRVGDYLSSQRIDKVLTNSRVTAERVRKYYGRSADVIYSFADIPSQETFSENYKKEGEFYVCISRLVTQKRIDIAVGACTQQNIPLVVIGDGPARSRLEASAGSCVRFTGYISDEEKYKLLGKSKGLIFPGVEDLGLTPIEAMAWGKGVIAYKEGGVTETVLENETGVFFDEQSAVSIIRSINQFECLDINPATCRARARIFSREVFNTHLQRVVDEVLSTR